MARRLSGFSRSDMTIPDRLMRLNWGLIWLLVLLASIGFVMLYSAANGSFDPWARTQMIRFVPALGAMFLVALIDLRFWLRYAYLVYLVGLILLILVEVMGVISGGAQRWLDIGFMRLQPSEFMKIALVMGLARYFHGIDDDNISRASRMIIPLMLIAVPAAIVARQPDLGTAVLLVLIGGIMFWLAGVRVWYFLVLGLGALASIPLGWNFLQGYQQKRILTFFNPESDPLGAGYHIMQSKIALGSGGVFGKGLLQGSQSHLNFLPEKQTDFIFTMLAEEFGLLGGLGVLVLFTLLLVYGIVIALRCRNQFGRLLAMGLTTSFFIYVFVNIGMVMGLLPVVGVPLPLISYGGTSQLTIMMGFGLLMSVYLHRDQFVILQGRTI